VSERALSAVIGSDFAELEAARDRVRAHLERAGVDETALYAIDLALEELAGNTIRYGKAETIRVDLAIEPSTVCLSIVDDGRSFDPTRHPEPVPVKRLADAPVGGRGIPLVRRFVRAMRYGRDGGRNRLEIEIPRAAGE